MSADYTDSKASRGSVYPLFSTNSGGNFNRVEPLLTPDILKSDFLFAVKLFDPVNKRPISDPDLVRAINRAVCSVELSLGLSIFPVQRTIKVPFDKSLFRSFGHTEIPFKPVLSIEQFAIESADQVVQFTFPANLLETSNLHLGLITFGALSLITPNGIVTSVAGGTGSSPLVLSSYLNVNFIPAFYKIVCTTGFPENKIPTVLNELIGVTTALDILSRVGPGFRNSSTSLSQDGLNQSISGLGPNQYKQRIDELTLRKEKIEAQLKSYFYQSMFVSNI